MNTPEDKRYWETRLRWHQTRKMIDGGLGREEHDRNIAFCEKMLRSFETN